MKAAVFGDVHGNWHALQAVFADIEQQEVDQIWCLGDLVCFGAYTQDVVRTIRKSDIISIQGNVDWNLLKVGKSPKELESFSKEEADHWLDSYRQLSGRSRRFLADLPETKKIKAGKIRFMLTHGSPKKNNETLLPDTPEERYSELARSTKVDVILSGHTHIPQVKQVEGVWFVNPGSVGRPLDGDWRTGYALLTAKKGDFSVEHRRLEYDVDAAVNSVLERGYPVIYSWMLKLGLSQEKVKDIGDPLKEKTS